MTRTLGLLATGLSFTCLVWGCADGTGQPTGGPKVLPPTQTGSTPPPAQMNKPPMQVTGPATAGGAGGNGAVVGQPMGGSTAVPMTMAGAVAPPPTVTAGSQAPMMNPMTTTPPP